MKADSLHKTLETFPNPIALRDSLIVTDTIERMDTIANTISGDTIVKTTHEADSMALVKDRTVIEAKIERTARDSIVQDLVNKKVYLYGDAVVTYQEITLKADYIEVDFNTNSLYATGLPDSTGRKPDEKL